MKLIVLNLIFILLFSACNGGSEAVDKFLGEGNIVVVEAPLDLDLTIDSPSTDGMSAGYSTILEGTCTLAGSVVEVTGSGTAFGICGIDLRWSAAVDLSAAPVGTITLNAQLTNGSQQSDTETRVLVKSSTACDTLAARTNTFASGTGTVGDPYIICTGTQLSNIRTSLTSSFELASDIELFGTPFNPLGNFSGNFEGNGFAIIDLNINQTGIDQVGFFSQFNGTSQTIQNVEFRNAIISGDQRVGVLVGRINSASAVVVIDNVQVTATVTGTDNLGGLIGQATSYTSLSVNDYTFQGSLSNIGSNAGGLAGFSRAITFTNGNLITTVNSQGSNVGGAIGSLDPTAGTSSTFSDINSALTNGTTTDLGDRNYIGGLIGYCRTGTNQRMNSFTNITGSAVVNVSGANDVQLVGGVFGQCVGNTFDTISGNLDLTVAVTTDNSQYAGGIAGRIYFDETSPITMTDWTSVTNVDGNINYVGGLAAYVERFDNHNSTITGSNFNASGSISSNVSVDTSGYLSGLIANFVLGNNSGRTTLNNLSWSGDIEGYGSYIATGFANLYLDSSTDGITLDNVNLSGDIDIFHNGGGTRLEYHGGLAGRFYLNNANTAELSNITVNSNITRDPSANGDQYMGGLAGYMYGNNTNALTVSGTNSVTGNISGAGNYLATGFGFLYYRNSPSEINISNVTLTGDVTHTEATANRSYIGGFAGSININIADFTLSNITYNGDIFLNSFANYVGGLSGYVATANNAFANSMNNIRNTGSTISNCLLYCAGLIGDLVTNNAAGYIMDMNSFSNTADVTSTYTAGNSSYTGGIIGRVNQRPFTLTNSENYGDITSQRDYVGGFIGYAYNRNNEGEMYGNSNLGLISGRDYVGGINGRSRIYLYGNMNTRNISGEDYVGGIIGRAESFNSNDLSVYENYSVGNIYFDDINASTSNHGLIAGSRGNVNILDGSNYYLNSRNVYDTSLVTYGNVSGLGVSRSDAQLSSATPGSDLPALTFGGADGQWTIVADPTTYTLPNGASYSYPLPSGL